MRWWESARRRQKPSASIIALWHALAAVMAPLPRRPISRDQVTLMQKDNVVSPGTLTFADHCITPTTLETIAPTYLRRRSAR